MSWNYGIALCEGDEGTGGTLEDLREGISTLEETGQIARRVFGSEHPIAGGIEHTLGEARAHLSRA